MNELSNEKLRGLNGAKIIRQDTTKYRSHNYFQVNPHVRILSQLFSKSAYLTQFREMLFLSLQQIYLRTQQILTVLQWMQPPILCNSKQKRDQHYLKVIQYAQQTRQLGVVPEQIFIIEIERFLKVIQNDNKEITLKILYELTVAMSCIIKGRQEFILYDKFFAYLFHQFNSNSDFVQMSLQQREYLKKHKLDQKLSKLNKYGLRKIGQISDIKYESQFQDSGELNFLDSRKSSNVALPEQEVMDYYNMYAEYFYDSVKNLIQCKGGAESMNYKFIGLKFNLKESLSLNAIYQHEEQQIKLFLHPFPLFSGQNEKQTTLTKYITLQTLVNNKEDQVENLQEFLQQSPPQSPHSSNQHCETLNIHQQTSGNEEFKIEYEVSNQNEFDLEGGIELNFSNFDPSTIVQFQVYSVNSECVAGIKITFPEERSSFPLIQFPCIEPEEGGYDCHSYLFKPLSNIKGCQIELIQVTQTNRFIKNFILLVQDSEQPKASNKLQFFQFDFLKNQEMGDIQNLHDQIIPYFNDDWRKIKFPLYVNFQFSQLPVPQQVTIEQSLKKISLAINSMFPNIEYLENKKRLINPNVFEIFVQSLGRHKSRDQYERTVFIVLENWQQLQQDRLIDTILDNIIIFIWSSGLTKSK